MAENNLVSHNYKNYLQDFTGFRCKYLSRLLVRNHRRPFRPKFWMVSRKKCSSRAEERIAKNWNDLTRAIIEQIDYNPFWDGTFAVYVLRPLFDFFVPALYQRFDRVEKLVLKV